MCGSRVYTGMVSTQSDAGWGTDSDRHTKRGSEYIALQNVSQNNTIILYGLLVYIMRLHYIED